MEKLVEDKTKQAEMHKDFFDRCKNAIGGGFYLEAILMEYAAIESRLEILLGVVGMPCNKFLDDSVRKNIQLSHRICCAREISKTEIFEKSKLPNKYFDNLLNWTKKRNQYIHGLYKNELKYSSRIEGAKQFAETGFEYCRLLYNEVNRLKRLAKNHPEIFNCEIHCSSSNCQLN